MKALAKRYAHKWMILGLCAALVAVFALSGIGCPFYRIFGIPCPGCGMTRAFLACLRLDFTAAWRYHPMVFSLPYLLALFWKDGAVFPEKRWNAGILALVCLGFLAQYLCRLFG